MAERETQRSAPAECRITELVGPAKSKTIVKRFKDGESTRTIARLFGLSRAGVEQLIRRHGWSRAAKKSARRVAAR